MTDVCVTVLSGGSSAFSSIASTKMAPNNKSIPKLLYLMLTMCLTCLIDGIQTVAGDLTKYTRDS